MDGILQDLYLTAITKARGLKFCMDGILQDLYLSFQQSVQFHINDFPVFYSIIS